MQFSNDAVETATSSCCNNKNHTSTSDNDCTLVDTDVTPMELRPIFKALKGYSLYTKDVKLQAVGDFCPYHHILACYKATSWILCPS